jgi:AcrR family transcriptional regulator
MDNTSITDIRSRLLRITEELIYQNGISATGMDLIVKTSGVSRKTIYRYFGNKDQLIAEVLIGRDERWNQWFEAQVRKAGSPRDQLLNIFEVLKSWFVTDGFRGCAFINTAGETGDSDDPVRQVARDHKEKLLSVVRTLCQEAGYRDPDALARQYLILIEGAITVAYVLGDSASADTARDIAQKLLDL